MSCSVPFRGLSRPALFLDLSTGGGAASISNHQPRQHAMCLIPRAQAWVRARAVHARQGIMLPSISFIIMHYAIYVAQSRMLLPHLQLSCFACRHACTHVHTTQEIQRGQAYSSELLLAQHTHTQHTHTHTQVGKNLELSRMQNMHAAGRGWGCTFISMH